MRFRCPVPPGIGPGPAAYLEFKEVILVTQSEMERFLAQHQGSDEDALMAELQRMTREQQQTGEMSSTRMEEIYETLSPFLSESQRKKMRHVIQRLKS